jgi:hypothetical protein
MYRQRRARRIVGGQRRCDDHGGAKSKRHALACVDALAPASGDHAVDAFVRERFDVPRDLLDGALAVEDARDALDADCVHAVPQGHALPSTSTLRHQQRNALRLHQREIPADAPQDAPTLNVALRRNEDARERQITAVGRNEDVVREVGGGDLHGRVHCNR